MQCLTFDGGLFCDGVKAAIQVESRVQRFSRVDLTEGHVAAQIQYYRTETYTFRTEIPLLASWWEKRPWNY
jgi:hypothetical protein